jgi:phenylalanyl-tRNA synthetase alpha chain
MLNKLSSIIEEINSITISDAVELESFKIKYLGKKGLITQLFNDFKSVPAEKKREFGQKLNEAKQLALQKYNSLKSVFTNAGRSIETQDLTLPGDPILLGSRHPISIARNKIIDIFRKQGFTIAEGPEIEDDWHNFSALNFTEDHPARDMQDTFFIQQDPDILLRTHTSSVQVRYMESRPLPIRAVFPGRVFRNEAISARAHCIFHQVEGLYIHKNVSFLDMKQILYFFALEMFGMDTEIRLRPSYFPFTEPSAEMDISCSICKGKGCNICKYTGWVEIMGCGMVDPNVLSNCGIDPEIYTGYAFGMGIERISMLKYGINDLRLYFENDKRLLDQFVSVY